MTTDAFAIDVGLKRLWRAIPDGLRQLGAADLVDTAIVMTLIMFLLYPGEVWYLRIPVKILAAAALVHRPLAHSPMFWFVLGAAHAVIQNLLFWFISDNHKYLYTYWCIALGCSLSCQARQDILSSNARALVGLTFLFATFRKLLAPEYLSGATFHYLLFSDSRFAEVARVFGRITLLPSDVPERHMAAFENVVAVPHTPELLLVAQVMTIWTVAVEGLIGYLFLRPRSARVDRWANFLLMYFILSVYPIAPVLGFAAILLSLGYAQCAPEMKRTRLCYLAMFVVMPVFSTRHLKGYAFNLVEQWLY